LGFFHFHELLREPQITNMDIMWSIFVNVYKHFKILYAQLRMPKARTNTCNTKNSLYFDLEANNPQNLLGYKTNIWNLCFMHPSLHHSSGFLVSSFVTFFTLKWLNYSFIVGDAISTLVYM
jgi:hypothetical protein